VYLLSITDDLESIADDALSSAFDAGKLPPITFVYSRDTQWDNICRSTEENSKGKHVETIYGTTTASFSSIVASTLEFQLLSWNKCYLEWTTDDSKSRAVADAFLNLDLTAKIEGLPPPLRAHSSR
jgi:hypothetical protein